MRLGSTRRPTRNGRRRNALRESVPASEEGPSERLVHDHRTQSIPARSSIGVPRDNNRIACARQGTAPRNYHERALRSSLSSVCGARAATSFAWNWPCADSPYSKAPGDEDYRDISFEEL